MTLSNRLSSVRSDLIEMRKELQGVLANEKTRARAPAVRMMHEVESMLSPFQPFASQAGQDRVIDRIFKSKPNGTFVDVGGYDGVSGSNSLYFEKYLGWTGVLVEPVAAQIEKAKKARTCPCLQYAVAEEDGEAQFIAVTEGFTQMSGLKQTYDAQLLDQVRADTRHVEAEITVETKTLSSILTEAGLQNPDFVSLDIEGGELSVLQNFPFAQHRVAAWAIENNTGSSETVELMRENGYKLVEFCGPDEIYALNELT